MNIEQIKERLSSFDDRDLGNGASEDLINEAEQAIHARLPNSYKDFLRCYGWGGVQSIELFGLGDDVPIHLDLINIIRSERLSFSPLLPSNYIPIYNDGFGNLYCLDISAMDNGECPVVFWDHELASSQSPEVVADNFFIWLNDLLDEL